MFYKHLTQKINAISDIAAYKIATVKITETRISLLRNHKYNFN